VNVEWMSALPRALFRFAGGTGGWALADQVVVSLGNFLGNVLLARHLAQSDYGAYALIFGTIGLLNGIHAALVIYPLSVHGATMSAQDLAARIATTLRWTVVLSAILSPGVVVAVFFVGEASLAVWALAALVVWQVHETTRRGLMAHLRHRDAILGDATFYLGWALLVWLLTASGEVTLSRAIMAFVLMAGLGAGVQAWQGGVRLAGDVWLSSLARQAWGLGHWMLGSAALSFFSLQAFPWALALFHTLEAAAEFQALSVVMGVLHPVLLGIGNLLIPAVARAHSDGGVRAAKRSGIQLGGQAGLLMLPYLVLVLTVPDVLLRLFFGPESPYMTLTTELRVMAAVYVVLYVVQVLSGVIHGLSQPLRVFVSNAGASVVALVVIVPFVGQWGVLGACVARLIVVAAQGSICAYFILRPEPATSPPLGEPRR
jgi:O-antigen/teichoic acid export membrane protein